MASTFTLKLSPEQVTALTPQIRAAGYDPDALLAGGPILLPEESGVQLGCTATRVMGTAIVTFTVVKKPALMPVFFIESKVKQRLGVA